MHVLLPVNKTRNIKQCWWPNLFLLLFKKHCNWCYEYW